MSADVGIDAWLLGLGFADAALPRAALEETGLTRPGKARLSNEKLARAAAVLSERFFVHCQNAECVAAAGASGKTAAPGANRQACERCGGSDNQRAANDFLLAFTRRGGKRLCIVGGSPSVWEELERLLGNQIELRLVDGTARRTLEHSKADLEWADLLLLWGATELHHKVSMLYTTAPTASKKNVLHVAKRGIAALLSAGVEHLRRRS